MGRSGNKGPRSGSSESNLAKAINRGHVDGATRTQKVLKTGGQYRRETSKRHLALWQKVCKERWKNGRKEAKGAKDSFLDA